MLILLLYVGSVIITNRIGVSSLREAGTRVATLSVIYLASLFFGSHLSFTADIFGLSLRSYRLVHGLIGFSAFLLGLFHVIMVILQGPRVVFNQFIISGIMIRLLHYKPVYDLIGSLKGGGLLLLLILAIPWVKQLSYELFLRTY